MRLRVTPITLREACDFVSEHHRHHPPPLGSVFQLAVAGDDEVRGVAIVGRPVGRAYQDGFTVEVTRVCTLGDRNAGSMLYGACWRAARALGYRRLITFTLPSESGASLRGAGYRLLGETRGQSWDRPGRPRYDRHPTLPKQRWEAM